MSLSWTDSFSIASISSSKLPYSLSTFPSLSLSISILTKHSKQGRKGRQAKVGENKVPKVNKREIYKKKPGNNNIKGMVLILKKVLLILMVVVLVVVPSQFT